jgi:prephenate dehydratase
MSSMIAIARPRVAFQGERGAFSEEAAVRLFGEDIELVPRPSFEALFSAVDEGVVVHLAHQPGALYRALGVFADRGLDLLKIESRPIHGRPWQYRFYLDLQASLDDPEVARALDVLATRADDVRVLGCYPAAHRGRR